MHWLCLSGLLLLCFNTPPYPPFLCVIFRQRSKIIRIIITLNFWKPIFLWTSNLRFPQLALYGLSWRRLALLFSSDYQTSNGDYGECIEYSASLVFSLRTTCADAPHKMCEASLRWLKGVGWTTIDIYLSSSRLSRRIWFLKCVNYFDTNYSIFFVLSGKILLNLCSILFVSSTFNCSFAILWRISKRCFLDTPCFIISELADSILDNTTNWLMLAVSLRFIPLDAKFGFACIIRKSKRCKNFKRCVHITKTSSTNGIPPSKEK